MQKILGDPNIKYIGRYRTETNLGKNEPLNGAKQQTTYLFWDTSKHDYISRTLIDVDNVVVVEETEPTPLLQAPLTLAPTLDILTTLPPTPPNDTKLSQQTRTANELLEKLPPVPTKPPQVTKKRRIEEPAALQAKLDQSPKSKYIPAMI